MRNKCLANRTIYFDQECEYKANGDCPIKCKRHNDIIQSIYNVLHSMYEKQHDGMEQFHAYTDGRAYNVNIKINFDVYCKNIDIEIHAVEEYNEDEFEY